MKLQRNQRSQFWKSGAQRRSSNPTKGSQQKRDWWHREKGKRNSTVGFSTRWHQFWIFVCFYVWKREKSRILMKNKIGILRWNTKKECVFGLVFLQEVTKKKKMAAFASKSVEALALPESPQDSWCWCALTMSFGLSDVATWQKSLA